jgi:hypothetical protein
MQVTVTANVCYEYGTRTARELAYMQAAETVLAVSGCSSYIL